LAIFFSQNKLIKTLAHFNLLKEKNDRMYWSTTLNRYKRDLTKEPVTNKRMRFPKYGSQGNDALCVKVQAHLDLGMPVKDSMLRMFLMEYLVEAGRTDILQDIAGIG
jgi:hypothetical protein